MGLRRSVGHRLDEVLGKQRTDQIRTTERAVRSRLAETIAPAPRPSGKAKRKKTAAKPRPAQKRAAQKRAAPKPAASASATPSWQPSDPFAPHPTPTMSRHELLSGLHDVLTPRTYFEIGVNAGYSLALSRVPTVGVDPAFIITREIRCDLDLIRATSDDFFAREEPFAHLDGVPVDLAFIDGMHLSEFALRDFLNTERHLAETSVVLLDDMLPRNSLEAARDRKTSAWAGDVYKVAEILTRHRPDLVVLPVNTRPTGTVLIVGVSPTNTQGASIIEAETAHCLAPDPQDVPRSVLERTGAVRPDELLALDLWPELVRRREEGRTDVGDLWDTLRSWAKTA